MEENKSVSVKNFFLQIGAIGSLYASLIAVVVLLFRVINEAYPMITNGYYYGGKQSISFQVAVLIVFFPIFLILSWLLQKNLSDDISGRDFKLRKWLSYLTLFVAGIIVAGDLVSVLYTFLDGQELTKAFLLKALTLLVVAGGAFVYFLQDIRSRNTRSSRKIWRIVSGLFILGSIILGFSIMGSPMSQRQERYDLQKLNDLQNIQWQIVNYWQQKQQLPEKLSDLNDPISNWSEPVDPETGASYTYNKTGNLSFELCAVFNKENSNGLNNGRPIAMPITEVSSVVGKGGENWAHQSGNHCFKRVIDPELYPTRKLPM